MWLIRVEPRAEQERTAASLTMTAAASAWAFRMLLFRSSGVLSGVAPGLLLAVLLRLHFSKILTTSSCNTPHGKLSNAIKAAPRP